MNLDKIRSNFIFIYGSSGSGKTILSGILTKGKKAIFINTDGNYRGLIENGFVRNEKQIIKIDNLSGGIFDYEKLKMVIRKIAANPQVEYVIIDNLTSIFENIQYYMNGDKTLNFLGKIKSNVDIRSWGGANVYAAGFFSELKKMNKKIILIAHEKSETLKQEQKMFLPNLRFPYMIAASQYIGAIWRIVRSSDSIKGATFTLYVNNNFNGSLCSTYFNSLKHPNVKTNFIQNPNENNLKKYIEGV